MLIIVYPHSAILERFWDLHQDSDVSYIFTFTFVSPLLHYVMQWFCLPSSEHLCLLNLEVFDVECFQANLYYAMRILFIPPFDFKNM